MFKTAEEVVVAIQAAQEKLNEQLAKTTDVSKQRARKITLELDQLHKLYRKLSVN